MKTILQDNWRPFCSLFLVITLGLSAFGITTPSKELFELGMLVIGGHGVMRSIDKWTGKK